MSWMSSTLLSAVFFLRSRKAWRALRCTLTDSFREMPQSDRYRLRVANCADLWLAMTWSRVIAVVREPTKDADTMNAKTSTMMVNNISDWFLGIVSCSPTKSANT